MFRKLRETETLANELLEFGKTQWIQDNNFVQVELKTIEWKSSNLFKVLANIFKFVLVDKMKGEGAFQRYSLKVRINSTKQIVITRTDDMSFEELKEVVDKVIEHVSTVKVDHSVFNEKLLNYILKFNKNTFNEKFLNVDIRLIQNNLDYVYADIEILLRVLYIFEKFEQLSSYVEQNKYYADIVEIVKELLLPELEKIDNIRSLEVDSALNRLKELAEKEG